MGERDHLPREKLAFGQGRRLANLAPGRSVPFRKSWRAGSGCPATRAEMQACTTYTIDMKVTRSKS